jgi:hypothetical protein
MDPPRIQAIKFNIGFDGGRAISGRTPNKSVAGSREFVKIAAEGVPADGYFHEYGQERRTKRADV